MIKVNKKYILGITVIILASTAFWKFGNMYKTYSYQKELAVVNYGDVVVCNPYNSLSINILISTGMVTYDDVINDMANTTFKDLYRASSKEVKDEVDNMSWYELIGIVHGLEVLHDKCYRTY